MLIKVRRATPLGDYRLRLEFSDDTIGERDLAPMLLDSGPMLEPLKSQDYFQRVFVENGVLTWPNGYDWDSIALHDEMEAGGDAAE